MSPVDLEAYFTRIGMDRPAAADLAALRKIQEHHIYHVPFENLDIISGNVPLSLEREDLFDKIVVRRRGGICYELNLLLADVLEETGFDVKRMSAMHPRYGNDFDHAFLMVSVPGDGSQWLTDVGFADNFRTVLRFGSPQWQSDGRDEYALREDPAQANRWKLVRRRKGVEDVMYTFAMAQRRREEYRERCDWYSTSEESRFTKGPLVCIERPEGRISLTMNRVMNTFDGQRVRSDIKSREEFDAALREIFGIEPTGLESLGE